MQEPAITQKDPIAYYRWLRAQRMPGAQATQLVEQRFGPPTTVDERNARQQAANENAALAQGAGVVGGALATNWAMGGFQTPQWYKDLTSSSSNTGGQLANSNITAAQNQQWNAAANQATSGTPTVLSSEGGMSTVQTPNGNVTQVPDEALNDPGFMQSANWDAIGSGAMSALAAYQAYKSYQSGDKVGAGLSGASSVALGAQAANQAGMSFAGSQTMGAAAPYLGVAAGVYQGYKTAEMIGDSAAGAKRNQQGALGGAASGALIGSYFGPWGMAIGAAVGAAAGAIGSWTGSSKGKAQFMRDNIRKSLQSANILDDKFQGTLADGSKYDFGQDGSKLKWKNIDKIAAEQPDAWSASLPLAGAIGAAYGFVGQKASDIAVMYAKGAVSNANNDKNIAMANMQHFAQQQGITYDMVKTKLDEALKDERIDQNQYNYYLSGAQQLTANVKQTPQNSIARPGKGQVARVSPGMYMNDQGQITRAKTVAEALKQNYQVSKQKEKKDERKG